MKQRSVSTSTFATMMITEPITRSTTMMMGTFDPFKIAEHSDVQWLSFRKKMIRNWRGQPSQLGSATTAKNSLMSCSTRMLGPLPW